jgi:PPOX class probable F420-dependent enzyme
MWGWNHVPGAGILVDVVALSRHVQSRLKKGIVVWLATTNPDGRPLVVPVWFLFEGDSFLIYSVPGQKVHNIQRNPRVSLHLNSNPEGGDVVRFEGAAQLPKRQPPAYKIPAYIRKYASHIKGYGWTPESFSADYRIPIRVRATKFHGG